MGEKDAVSSPLDFLESLQGRVHPWWVERRSHWPACYNSSSAAGPHDSNDASVNSVPNCCADGLSSCRYSPGSPPAAELYSIIQFV